MIRPRMLAGTLVVLAACAQSVNVKTQAAPGFSGVGRTFRVLDAPRRGDGTQLSTNDPMLNNSITNRALRDDIISAMEARGYSPASGGSADVDVAYYATAQQKLDVRSYDYGYSWRRWPREYTEVTPYESGTVILDLVDPTNHELLWRGRGVAQVSDDPNRYTNELGKVVNSIAKKLPAPR
jgi:hypothetical protein